MKTLMCKTEKDESRLEKFLWKKIWAKLEKDESRLKKFLEQKISN